MFTVFQFVTKVEIYLLSPKLSTYKSESDKLNECTDESLSSELHLLLLQHLKSLLFSFFAIRLLETLTYY